MKPVLSSPDPDLRAAIIEAAETATKRGPRKSNRNPLYEPNAAYDRALGIADDCRRVAAVAQTHPLANILAGCLNENHRTRTIAAMRECRDALAVLLSDANAADI
jgi:hypothetical protein